MCLQCFSFKVQIDSRWATHGSVCRVLVASLAMGLASLIVFVQDSKLTSEFYTGSFRYLTPELSWFSLCVSFIAYPKDAILLSLMVDDRVVLQHDEIKEAFKSERCWLGALPSALQFCSDSG